MNIRPKPFYKNETNEEGTTISAGLRSEFVPNTQYIFNLWIDADDSINSSGSYKAQGMNIFYTDGTNKTLYVTGNANLPGFQHKFFITPADKSVDYIYIYYGLDVEAYYRYDSFIIPIQSPPSLNRHGVFNSELFLDNISTVTELNNFNIGNGYVAAGNYIEY